MGSDSATWWKVFVNELIRPANSIYSKVMATNTMEFI